MMNNDELAKHIRKRADRIMETRSKSNLEAYDDAKDNAELLCVLARILEGRTVEQAFGGTCIWGYSTPIGKALAEPSARQAVEPPGEAAGRCGMSETAKQRRFETLVVEVVDPAVYDAHNPMAASIPGARVSAWSMGHRLDVHNLMYEKIEAFCDGHCDHSDYCEECPLQAAKQAWCAS